MTAKNSYEASLVELNKENAPSLLLEEYNYLYNKAVNQYINKRYNIYDISQQTTDDLRVLKSNAVIFAKKYENDLEDATYVIELPQDYLHMLNCTCIYTLDKSSNCNPSGKYVRQSATRLTADVWSRALHNAYWSPSYRRPYYYIHNVNQKNSLPTNPYKEGVLGTTDQYKSNSETTEYPRMLSLKNIKDKTIGETNLVKKESYSRVANPIPIRCEIRYGNDDIYKLEKVSIDYLKAPQYVELTQEQLDSVHDNSQILEFSDNVCYEIINELVHLVMENASDQRLQTHYAFSQSIPTQQQTQSQKTS